MNSAWIYVRVSLAATRKRNYLYIAVVKRMIYWPATSRQLFAFVDAQSLIRN